MHLQRKKQKAIPITLFENCFLEEKKQIEKTQVFEHCQITADRLQNWAMDYKLVRPERIMPLALTLSSTHPVNDLDAVFISACTNLWIFAIDDFIDESKLADEELKIHAETYQSIIKGHNSPTPSDELGGMIHQIRTELQQYPLFKELENDWTEALCRMIRGMTMENQWRDEFHSSRKLPSIKEYLENGLYSVGGPPHIWTVLITLGDPSAVPEKIILQEMGKLASTCIRLANDWQSYEKEVREGGINALTIWNNHLFRELDYEIALKKSQNHLIDLINQNLKKLKAIKAEIRTTTGFPEQAIENIAEFVCEFYMQHDFHTMVQDFYFPSEIKSSVQKIE